MSTKEIKTRSDGEENKVPHSISVRGNIATALKLLQNNSVLRRSPAGVPVHMDFAPEAVEMARSLFPAGKPYVFEMHFSSTLASTAGGVLQHICPGTRACHLSVNGRL
jgi:hypothetical protein